MAKLILSTTDFVALLPKGSEAPDHADVDENVDWEWEYLDDEDELEDGDELVDARPGKGSHDFDGSDNSDDGDDSDDEGEAADLPGGGGAGSSEGRSHDDSDEQVEQVEVEVEQEGETVGELEEQVAEIEDGALDALDGIAGTVPTATYETSDELISVIEEHGKKATIEYKKAGIDLPYTPHPDAVKHDKVVVYDENNTHSASVVTAARTAVSTVSRAISTQLRRILWSRSTSRVQRDQQRGRLDRSKLHTLNRPGRRPNRRVFSRTVQGQSQDIAIGLLIDQSGSMWGSKIACAREATIALGDALDTLGGLGIQFGVWGFDTDHKGARGNAHEADRVEALRFHEFKAIGESWRRVSARVGAMEAGNNNVDGESIRWAAAQLREVDASRRILIVLSDGSPACYTYNPGRVAADLKAAVTELNESGVETFGLGICDHSVRHFYPDHAVITKASELETKLMSALQKMLLGVKAAA